MNNEKYGELVKTKEKHFQNCEEYNVILILKMKGKVVLIKNESSNYDFLRFNCLSIDFIHDIIYDQIKLDLKLKNEGYVKDNNGTIYYIFTSSISKVQLEKLGMLVNVKIVKELDIKKIQDDDKYELLKKIMPKETVDELVFLLLIPLGIIVAVIVFVYNLIKGKVLIEFLIAFGVLIIIIVIGVINYYKK